MVEVKVDFKPLEAISAEYEVIELISSGLEDVVFFGIQKEQGKECALKCPTLSPVRPQPEHIAEEARRMKAVHDHPHIPKVLKYHEEGVLVTEFVEQGEHPSEETYVRQMLYEIAFALTYYYFYFDFALLLTFLFFSPWLMTFNNLSSV